MTSEDPSLTLPPPVTLTEPLGPLAHELTLSYASGDDAAFAVAGRRARVTGGVARGADAVQVGPLRIATEPRVVDAACDGATVTPLGLERRLWVGDTPVVERVVVPRDMPLALFEWSAPGAAIALDVAWTTGLTAAEAPRWRQSAGVLVVAGRGVDRALFLVGGPAGVVSVEKMSDDASRLRIRARIEIPAGGSVRLAMAGGDGDAVTARALRSARFAGAAVQARCGIADRLRQDHLALDTPDPALDRAVEWAKVRLADHDHASGHGALDCLLVGDFESALYILRGLGERAGAGDPRAIHIPYLRLAGEYLAWTGDIASLQTEWPRLLTAWRDAGGAGDERLRHEVARGMIHLAEAVGDRAAAAEVRAATGSDSAGGRIGTDKLEVLGHDAAPLERVRMLLGAEPDAVVGRLVLRPRPPAEWDRFEIRSLAIGDAVVDLRYRRDGVIHRFVVSQRRGASPIRCILEPELPGRLRAARVDGVEARLEPVIGEDRSRVPVQLALDHDRSVELDMAD